MLLNQRVVRASVCSMQKLSVQELKSRMVCDWRCQIVSLSVCRFEFEDKELRFQTERCRAKVFLLHCRQVHLVMCIEGTHKERRSKGIQSAQSWIWCVWQQLVVLSKIESDTQFQTISMSMQWLLDRKVPRVHVVQTETVTNLTPTLLSNNICTYQYKQNSLHRQHL